MMRYTLLFAGLLACGPESTGTGDTDSSSTGATTTTTTTTSTTTSSTGEPEPGPTTSSSSGTTSEPTTGAPDLTCTCSEQPNCPGELNDCDAPEPCDLVDEDNTEAADCVLARLQPENHGFFQFRYCHQCDSNPRYEGTFVVRGDGRPGVDMQCYYFDFSETLTIAEHTIETPAYFAACSEIAAFKERRTCLLNGFEPGDVLPMCE